MGSVMLNEVLVRSLGGDAAGVVDSIRRGVVAIRSRATV
jgi:hypothetical protein